MSLLYRFKPQKDRSLRSVTTRLDGAGITANEVTAPIGNLPYSPEAF
jgi:hypothetical protein